jgi:hypothetical protein
MRLRDLTHSALGITAGLAIALVAPASRAQSAPAHGRIAITCTNPYSGVNWRIEIDYDSSTVDSNPADITGTTISWQDDKSGRKYRLDRKSGTLTVTLASATGGNFLYDQCKLDR